MRHFAVRGGPNYIASKGPTLFMIRCRYRLMSERIVSAFFEVGITLENDVMNQLTKEVAQERRRSSVLTCLLNSKHLSRLYYERKRNFIFFFTLKYELIIQDKTMSPPSRSSTVATSFLLPPHQLFVSIFCFFS